MALIVGSLFYGLGHTVLDCYSRAGAEPAACAACHATPLAGLLFFLMTNNAFSAVELIPLFISKRNVFFEQKKAGYFHGAVYYLAVFITS